MIMEPSRARLLKASESCELASGQRLWLVGASNNGIMDNPIKQFNLNNLTTPKPLNQIINILFLPC
ncbi:MAG TPA: hypothetical protein DEQ09_00320 [Bacteroidales bacterium]|nr:hypothetical protein [Bacteroidales bacterium]